MAPVSVRTGAAFAAVLLSACAVDEPELGTTSEAIVDPTAFMLPPASATKRASIVRNYDALDPGDTVPRGLLEDAVAYFDLNKSLIPKTEYIIVVDFSRRSGLDRFWMVDLATGLVENHKVAHGSGSDPDNDGYATLFSNVGGSNQSSLGYYLTGEIYDGTHPHSMRLDGLSRDGSPNQMANTNVRDRLVVVHEASYVADSNGSQQGRSNGCLALDPAIEAGVVDRIHDGTLIYAAISPLNPPVGRAACGDGTCDGAETSTSCPSDCVGTGSGSGSDGAADDPNGGDVAGDGNDMGGGCSTSDHGAGIPLVFGWLAVRRRRRK